MPLRHLPLSLFLSQLTHQLAHGVTVYSSSSPSSRTRVSGRLQLPLLRRLKVKTGREALAGGGPVVEREDEGGIGATVALTLLLVPSLWPWFCCWMKTKHTFKSCNIMYVTNVAKKNCNTNWSKKMSQCYCICCTGFLKRTNKRAIKEEEVRAKNVNAV